MARIARVRFAAGRLMALLVLLFASAALHAQDPSAATADSSVFIDRSGSMKPYYASGLIDDIVQPIDRAATSAGGLSEFAFSTGVTRVRTLNELKGMPFGNLTFLDKVIDTCEQARTPIAWIVTDNIEDTGEAGNTDRFYAKLHGPDVLRVTVFPVVAPAGHPGLIVYALLFNPNASAAYDQMLAAFRANAEGVIHTNPLRMKPVDRDTVEVTSRKTTPLNRRGNEKVYQTGVPIIETIEVRFHSKFDHLEIVDSSLRVLDAAPEFQPGSVLYPERRDIAITPDRVRSLGPGDETAQVYILELDLGKVELKHNPAALWKAAWTKPVEPEQLDLRFEIDVPRQNFQLRPQFLQEYSASTLAEASATGKVYAIDRLLSRVNGDVTQIQVDSPLFFKVMYPTWPAVLWLVLFALALALLIGIFFLLRPLMPVRRKDWAVAAEAPGGYNLAATVEASKVIVEGDFIGMIEKNSFVPTGTTKLERGAVRIPLENGIRIPVRTRRSEMDLIFTESMGSQTVDASPPAGVGSTRPYTAAAPSRSSDQPRPPAATRPSDNPARPPRRR
ncbi:MAG TPA: hypothetical protein VGD59_12730 [Acidisarcina sp.]